MFSYCRHILYVYCRPITRHQYHLQLKQTSKDVQNELQDDKKLMDKIMRFLEQDDHDVIDKEIRKKADSASILLSEYTLLETEREQAMEFMFL